MSVVLRLRNWSKACAEGGKRAKSKSDQESVARGRSKKSVSVSSGMKTEDGHWLKHVMIFVTRIGSSVTW